MTRLDSVIRRLQAQRSLLDWAAGEVASRPGLVLELGLGNGRTYDHLRERLPGRDIYAFDRQLAAHPSCIPSKERLFLGDIFETLPAFAQMAGPGSAVLIHSDLGSGDEEANRRLVLRLSPILEPLLAPGALMIADRAYDLPGCEDISAQTGVSEGRYFVYRRQGP
jgi:hypothetical protein